MIDPNDIDTEGTNRVDAVSVLIHSRVGAQLRRDPELVGKLSRAEIIDSETVKFGFNDGRTITVRTEISPKS